MKRRSDAISAARNSDWLSRQAADFKDAICHIARTLSVPKGEYLFHVGDPADEFFFVVDGVLITCGVHPVMGEVLGQVNHPGQWFGEPAALGQRPRLGGMLARRTSFLVAVRFSQLAEVLGDRPDFAIPLFDLMTNNTEEHMLHGLDLLIQNPKKRLCSRLLTLAGRRVNRAPPVQISIPLSQEELALTSCMSRQTVNQILSELVEARICDLSYGEVRLRNTRALAQLVA